VWKKINELKRITQTKFEFSVKKWQLAFLGLVGKKKNNVCFIFAIFFLKKCPKHKKRKKNTDKMYVARTTFAHFSRKYFKGFVPKKRSSSQRKNGTPERS
jgi:hypothetical protein